MIDYESTLRREIKFATSEMFRPYIDAWIMNSKLGLRKHYDDRIVNNIYFDSHNYSAYSDNLAGISDRAKMRYRWYGKHVLPTDGILEIKKKINAFGFKGNIPISNVNLEENPTYDCLLSIIRETVPEQMQLVLDYFSCPMILNRYHRSYFLSPFQNIRVTLDSRHEVYDQRFHAEINTRHKANVVQNLVVEIKFHPDITDHVSALIDDIPMQISRNSKYINSVRAVSGY